MCSLEILLGCNVVGYTGTNWCTVPPFAPKWSTEGEASSWNAADDTDGDGLTDLQELLQFGTNPFSADTDGDGIPDGAEIDAGTDPLVADTDGDGIPDGEEIELDLDPTSEDSNGNGCPDLVELNGYCDFVANPCPGDVDGDGVIGTSDLLGILGSFGTDCNEVDDPVEALQLK